MRDGQNVASSSTLTLTVNGANDAPVASADTGSAGENETKSFDVVANDTEVDTADTRTLDATLTVDAVTSANGQVDGIDASAAFAWPRANPRTLSFTIRCTTARAHRRPRRSR
jgi:hypothetical protein